MSKQDILDIFKDINYEYNDSTRFTTLKNMLNEMCEECCRVEVVRCKECVNWDRDWEPTMRRNDVMEWHYCPMIDSSSHSDWFCADGERKVQE